MSYDYYRFDNSPKETAFDFEREEHRAAARHDHGACPPGQHHMQPDRRGGGICACGERVDREEL